MVKALREHAEAPQHQRRMQGDEQTSCRSHRTASIRRHRRKMVTPVGKRAQRIAKVTGIDAECRGNSLAGSAGMFWVRRTSPGLKASGFRRQAQRYIVIIGSADRIECEVRITA